MTEQRSTETKPGLDRRDAALLAAILVGVALCVAQVLRMSSQPQEDAAILMRYAQHLADGHGIVWNVGEAPVDGGTDFLFMVLVAGVMRAGLSVEAATRALCIIAHVLTVVLVYVVVRRLNRAPRWAAAIAAGYLAIGPGLGYITAFFGTPFYALLALATWASALQIADAPSSKRLALQFGLCAVATALTRPDGVLLSLFILAALIYRVGWRSSRRVVLTFGVVFLVIGAAYFAWRWSYFGHPLPNPYYKKGGGHLYPHSLTGSVMWVLYMPLPFWFPFIAGLRSPSLRRQTLFALIPVVGFTAVWVLISDDTNHLGRFQYALLPIVLTSWHPLVRGLRQDWRLPRLGDLDRSNRAAVLAGALAVGTAILGYQWWYSKPGLRPWHDGRREAAALLRQYGDRGYVLATSEAGLLPLYSEWRTVDVWGLNDPWVAHHGQITEARLAQYRPHVVMFHAYFSPVVEPDATDAWGRMTVVLRQYAERNGYTLAAAFGRSPYETHYYYVRPGFPDAAGITRGLRDLPYTWYHGAGCLNYASLPQRH